MHLDLAHLEIPICLLVFDSNWSILLIQVYCIDYSAIILHTKKIILANGFDGKITAIRSKVEEATLPVDKVSKKLLSAS